MRYQHWKEVVTLTNYAVEIKNVCKRFPLPTGGELEACKDINITLEKGESLGIVGESGSGLNHYIILGFLKREKKNKSLVITLKW